MANHSIKTINTTESVRLTPNGMHSGMDITIQNVSDSGYIYLGGDDTVTSTSYGYRLSPNQAWSVELPGMDALYAISSVDAMSIAVMELGLESQD